MIVSPTLKTVQARFARRKAFIRKHGMQRVKRNGYAVWTLVDHAKGKVYQWTEKEREWPPTRWRGVSAWMA